MGQVRPLASPSPYKIRAAKISDRDKIAELLTSTFEAPLLKWYELPELLARKSKYQVAIGKRLHDSRRTPQLMVVAEAMEVGGEGGGRLVAFAEVGMLPPPPGYDSSGATGETLGSEEASRCSADVPYLANVVVSGDARRSGLGRRIVDVCARWAAKTTSEENGMIFATVDEREVTNLPAKRFYESLGFTAIPPPLEAEARLRFYNRARTYYARSLQTATSS